MAASPPYITGIVDDGESVQIEMPRLLGSWQRAVVWLAPEGTQVKEGDLIAKLERGDLAEQEEQARVGLEEQELHVASQIAQHKLAVIDAQTELYRAKSQLAIAKLDAEVPIEAVTELDHENAQLAYANAKNRLTRAEASLVASREKLSKYIPVSETQLTNTRISWGHMRDALDAVDIYAERSGIMIYAENPMTGAKIFPGETLTPGTPIATLANQEQLQFVFWVHDIDRIQFQDDMQLIVTPDALPSESVEAKISFIANFAVERESWSSGGYFQLIAKPVEALPNSFLPGMAVVGRLKS